MVTVHGIPGKAGDPKGTNRLHHCPSPPPRNAGELSALSKEALERRHESTEMILMDEARRRRKSRG